MGRRKKLSFTSRRIFVNNDHLITWVVEYFENHFEEDFPDLNAVFYNEDEEGVNIIISGKPSDVDTFMLLFVEELKRVDKMTDGIFNRNDNRQH